MSDVPRLLLFDMGNVLFPLEFANLNLWLRQTFGLRPGDERSVFGPDYAEYERGRLDTAEFLEAVRRRFPVGFDVAGFKREWNAIWRVDMPGMRELLDECRGAGIPLYLLSNINELHAQHFLKHKGILKSFERCFLSYEIGFNKPDSGIYRHVIDELGVPPESILFFDDLPANVEGARACGMRAHVFTSTAAARRHILEAGLRL